MRTDKQSLTYRQADNHRPCEVRGCMARRFGVSNYCAAHMRANRLHGHPLGARVLKRDYAPERAEMARLITERHNEPGVRAALDWLQGLLTRANYGTGEVIGRDEFQRLSRAGITPRRMLEECAAVFAYSRRNPARLPDDARLDFALASAAIHCAPEVVKLGGTKRRYRTAPRAAREQIGGALRQRLAPLLYNLVTNPAIPLPTP